MALAFHQGLAIPLSAIALCAIALTSPSRPLPSVTALLAIAVIASMMTVMGRRLGTPRPLLAGPPMPGRNTRRAGLTVVTGGACIGTLERPSEMFPQETDDALDLVRMDDDGGWQAPLKRSHR